MNREIVIAKIKRQQAEIKEMLETLRENESEFPRIIVVLRKLHDNAGDLVQTLEDDSVIVGPGLDVSPEIDAIKKGVHKVKSGVKKIRKIAENIAEDIEEDIGDVEDEEQTDEKKND